MPKHLLMLVAVVATACSGGSDVIPNPPPPPPSTGTLGVSYAPVNAHVTITPQANSTTNSTGVVTYTLSPGEYTVEVRDDPDYKAEVYTVQMGAGRSKNISLILDLLPPLATLSASSDSIESGATVRLTPGSGRATSCVLNPGGQFVSGPVDETPSTTTTYTLTCTGSGGTTSASTTIRVLPPPQITVQIYGNSPNGSILVPNAQAVFTSGSWGDSTSLNATGHGSVPADITVQSQIGAIVCMNIMSDFWKNSGCVSKAEALGSGLVPIGFVVEPKNWTVAYGRFVGKMYAYDPTVPYTQASDGLRFYSFGAIVRSPLPWAWDQSCSDQPVTTWDSVFVSQKIAEFKDATGLDLFRASTLAEVTPDHGLRFCLATSLGGEGRIGSAAIGVATDNVSITYGTVFLIDRTSMVNVPNLVLHELGHILGFGHDDHRQSIMTPCACSNMESDTLTFTDVALIQIRYAGKKIALDHSTMFDFEQSPGSPVVVGMQSLRKKDGSHVITIDN